MNYMWRCGADGLKVRIRVNDIFNFKKIILLIYVISNSNIWQKRQSF